MRQAWRRHPWLAVAFARAATGKLRCRYAPLGSGRSGAPTPPRAATWRDQRRALVAAARGAVVLLQWGPRVRLLRGRDGRGLGLPMTAPPASWRRGRAGWCIDQALAAGRRVLLVVEGAPQGSGPRPRAAAWLLTPPAPTALWWQRWVGSGELGVDVAVAPAVARPRRPRHGRSGRREPLATMATTAESTRDGRLTLRYDGRGQRLLALFGEEGP